MPELTFSKDGNLIVSHVMGMNIFVPPPLMKKADAVRQTYQDWVQLCRPESFTFYATETMRKHRKVSKKTLDMVPSWLDAGMPRGFFTMDLISSEKNEDECETRIFIHSLETEYDQNVDEKDKLQSAILRLTLPVGKTSDDAFLDQFLQVLGRFPFVSAAAGHALVTSQYAKRFAETKAWAASMRHPGTDIYAGILDAFTTGLDGLKTVNWLTAINTEMVEALGGRVALSAELPGEVQFHPLENGLVLQAGPEPLIGDVNMGDTLPLYRAVDAVLKPIRDRRADHTKSFIISGNDGTGTARWLARFEPSE